MSGTRDERQQRVVADPAVVFGRTVCFHYSSSVFSVNREAASKNHIATSRTEQVLVIEPWRISYFSALKQEAFRLCRCYGTKMKLLDRWIVPFEDRDALSRSLLDISHRWNEFVLNELLPNYEGWVERQAVENPDKSTEILALAPTLTDVRNSTRFTFSIYSVRDLQSSHLNEQVAGLWGQVLHEVAAEIRDSHMDRSASFTQAACEVLRRIARKCRGLVFLHPRLGELSDALEALVTRLPTAGKITGVDALEVRALLDALLDPAEFMERGFQCDSDEHRMGALASEPMAHALRVARHASKDADETSNPAIASPAAPAAATSAPATGTARLATPAVSWRGPLNGSGARGPVAVAPVDRPRRFDPMGVALGLLAVGTTTLWSLGNIRKKSGRA